MSRRRTVTRRAASQNRLAIAAVAALSVSMALGCAGKGDVDRSQADKVKKAIFFNPDGSPKPFYYRWTIVDVPPNNGWAFEGLQGSMQKVVFKVTEDQLIGYQAYDIAPGSGNPFTDGSNNDDAPVFSFKIKSHFDVKREYNAGTGEETNVISENTTDRHWSQREYMRIDWSTDKLANPLMDLSLQPDPTLGGAANQGTQAISEVELANPGHAIYGDDYLDITIETQATPDYSACLALAAPDDVGLSNCAPAKIGLRHSLMAVKESEYEPLEYPDNQPLLDANGKPINVVWTNQGVRLCDASTLSHSGGTYSGADCSPVGADQFSKFGFFRTVRQHYDPRLGATEQTRKYMANRWNIWDRTLARDASGAVVRDATGNPMRIPESARQTRQIPYYLNVEFPDDDPMLLDTAGKVVEEWNDAMKRTVAALRTTATAENNTSTEAEVIAAAAKEPDIFVLRKNSCNVEGVTAYLTKHSDMVTLIADKTGIDADPSLVTRANLVPICSAMEALTRELKDDDAAKFTWQRNGDLRYSFVYWVDRPQNSAGAPLGYGPSSPDPETGEIKSASLYLYGAALNTYTQMAADSVDLVNGKLSTDDLLSGRRITDVLRETAANRKQREALTVTPEARAYAHALASAGGIPGTRPAASSGGGNGSARPGASRFVTVNAHAADAKLEALKGTPLERQMMTEDMLAAFVPGYIPGRTRFQDLTTAQLAKASPLRWLSENGQSEARRSRFQRLATNGCVFTADFADDAILGTALQLGDLSGEPLFRTLRATIFRGLADHEMGHTMGLRHNFAGSTDALNYGSAYWNVRTNLPESEWAKASLSEHQYSTVMDYGARFNTDVHGLGRYDYAAIRFGYGQLIDTMPQALEAGDELRSDITLGDYKQLPLMVGGITQMEETAIVPYRVAVKELEQGYRDLAITGGFRPRVKERPYKFCSDEFEGNLDCKVWDMGANQQEIVNNVIDLYRNYYVFNGYQRGRLDWSIDGYLGRLSSRYFNRFSEAFQFYYYFGDSLSDYYLSDDLLAAAMLSLNALGEVLQTPEPGPHCATNLNPDLLTISEGFGPLDTCRNDAPQANITVPDARPYYIQFSNDYYYRITRAGSLYEKLAALDALTSTQSRFFRVDSFADQDRFSISYYRIFKDQLINLLSGVIRNDPTTYGGYVSEGVYRPTPVVDPATFGKATFPVPAYLAPTAKRVDTPVNKTIRYFAMGLALARLDSTWDSTLDFSSYMNVTLKGASDDVTYAPGTPVVEFADPISHLVYRAAQVDAQRPGIGVTVLKELNQLVGIEGTPGSLPKKYGTIGGQPLPDWYTAKANLAAAQTAAQQNVDVNKTAALQRAYEIAVVVFNAVDYYVNYRVDLLGDIRAFRHALID